MFASKPFEDVEAGHGSAQMNVPTSPGSTRLSVSSGSSFLSRSTQDEKLRDLGASSQMLALSFDDDAKMQSYLKKSYSFVRRQVQVPEGREEICV